MSLLGALPLPLIKLKKNKKMPHKKTLSKKIGCVGCD